MDRENMAIIGAVVLLLVLIFFFFGGGEGPATCTSDTDCGAGEICGPEGTCGFFGGPGSPCNLNEDCQEGLLCIDGFCQVPPEPGGPGSPCNLNDDCQAGLLCIDGTCQAPGTDSCAEIQCPTPQVCYGGACVSPGVADCLSQGGTWMEKEGVCCPSGTEWDFGTSKCELSAEAANCISQGGTWNEATDSCNCPPRYSWDSEIGECVSTWGPACDPPCEEGQACVGGECVPLSSLSDPNTPLWIYSPTSGFCDGCPAEDSLVTQMFLDPDINEKTVSAVLFVEKGAGERALVTDATFFVQIVPKDGSLKTTCRINSFEAGEAEFAYSNYPICEDVGCMVRFIFCCADVSEGCLIPLCLNDALVQEYTDVSPCDSSFSGDWPVKAKVDGETITLYPAIDEISIPPKPKFEGTAFAFELCLPVLVIFGLLSAAMFAAGRNPFQMFAFHTQRVKRAPERAIRARGVTININAIAGSVVGAVRETKSLVGGMKEKAALEKQKPSNERQSGRKLFRQAVSESGYTVGKKMRDFGRGMKDIKGIISTGKGIGKGGIPVSRGSGEGAGGPAARTSAPGRDGSTAMVLAPTDSPEQRMVDRGWGQGKDARIFFSLLGVVLLSKLLANSAFTSWIIYGGPVTGFRGLKKKVDERTMNKAAPDIMNRMSGLLAEMGVKIEKTEDGNTTITYNDPRTGKPVTAGYDLNSREGQSKLLKDVGGTVVPILIIYARAANRYSAYLSEKGGDLHDSQRDAVKAGGEIFGPTATRNLTADEAEYQLTQEPGIPGREPLSTTDVLDIVARAKGMKTDAGKNILETSSVQRALGDIEARLKAGETVTQADLQLYAAAYQNASGSMGTAGLTGTDGGSLALQRAGELLVFASAEAAKKAPEGSKEQADALAFALYTQSMVADSATRAGNGGLQDHAMQNLGVTHAFATAEGSPVPKTENLNTMLSNFEGEGNPQRYTAAVEGAELANGFLKEHAKALAGMQLTREEYCSTFGENSFNAQYGSETTREQYEQRYGKEEFVTAYGDTGHKKEDTFAHPPDALFGMPDDGTFTHLTGPGGDLGRTIEYFKTGYLAETMYSSSLSNDSMLEEELKRARAGNPYDEDSINFRRAQEALREQAQQTAQEMAKGAAAQGPEGQRGLDSYTRLIGEGRPMDTHPGVTTTTTSQGVETSTVQNLGDQLLSNALAVTTTSPSETSKREAKWEMEQYEQQLERNRRYISQKQQEYRYPGEGLPPE